MIQILLNETFAVNFNLTDPPLAVQIAFAPIDGGNDDESPPLASFTEFATQSIVAILNHIENIIRFTAHTPGQRLVRFATNLQIY